MEDFDIEYGQSLLDNRKYFEYAKYLSKFRGSNSRNQAEIKSRIKQYNRLGAIQEAMLENTTPEEQQAYHYISGMNGAGTIPNPKNENDNENLNSFADSYTNAINNLQSRDGKRISNFNIRYSKDEFLQLCNNLNTTAKDIYRQYGFSASEDNNGNVKISITPDNKKLPIILNANYEFDLSNIRSYSPEGIYMTSMVNNYKRQRNANRITAIDEDGKVLSIDEFNKGNLDIALGTYNKANKLYSDILKRQKSESNDEILIATSYLGEGHKQAYDEWIAGQIKDEEYNRIVKIRKEQYDRLLRKTDLTQFQMYIAGEKEKNGFKLVKADNNKRLEFMKHISAAMQEGRLDYTAGMLNGQLGTVIDISQNYDKDRKLSDKEGDKMYRIFVPGLFTKSAQKSFEADSQGAAVVENADMMRWNYGKTLSDGTKVGYDKQIGPYVLAPDENGHFNKVPVDESFILSALNKDIIIERAVDKVFGLFDKDNNISNDILKGSSQKDFLSAIILNLSGAATNELYPENEYTSDERAYQRDTLYRTIYKLLQDRLNNYGH